MSLPWLSHLYIFIFWLWTLPSPEVIISSFSEDLWTILGHRSSGLIYSWGSAYLTCWISCTSSNAYPTQIMHSSLSEETRHVFTSYTSPILLWIAILHFYNSITPIVKKSHRSWKWAKWGVNAVFRGAYCLCFKVITLFAVLIREQRGLEPVRRLWL